jgi:hypothetical protein
MHLTLPGRTVQQRPFLKTVLFYTVILWNTYQCYYAYYIYKGNNKITELRTILQRESQNS